MADEEILSLLGRRIRYFREERGWSQEELARRCEKHFTYIGRVERGKQNITVESLNTIAHAVGVPITELLIEDNHPLLDRWNVTAMDIIEAVNHGFRAQVDVKGKLAELMLYKYLSLLKKQDHVQNIEWLDKDNKPDFIINIGKEEIIIECKNVRSRTEKERLDAPIRVELQKTRNSRDGSNTRGYRINHFDVLSVCLFNRIGSWKFLHIAINNLATRDKDASCLKVMHKVPTKAEPPWRDSILEAIEDRLR